jgi:hypothetical protein
MAYTPNNPNGQSNSQGSAPVVQSIETATGNITTQNLVPSGGTPTPNSFVEINAKGSSIITIQITGTYTGALSVQLSNNGVNWATVTSSSILNCAGGGLITAISSGTSGIFQIQVAGLLKVRVTALAAVTGSAVILLTAINSTGLVTISNSLPGGNNSIGNIGTVAGATLSGPVIINDIVSAALTSTSTTAAIAVTGTSYSINIPVTAVSGTNPILDVVIQESDDAGTNWFNVYSFPRITATGIYRSPVLPLRGNRIRYVQTVAGTTPSFTRSTNRMVMNTMPITAISQLIDRSIVLTTLNSVTPSLNVQGARNLQLLVNIGTAATPPQLQLEGSDDNGLSWYAIGTPLTAVASSTVQFALATNMNSQLVRARVSTIGVTVVAGYVLIKGF